MSEPDSDELSKIYKDSERIKITLTGKKFEKIRIKASEDQEQFWGEQAKNLIWFKDWERVLDWKNPPFAKWFVGGKLNASVNCIDKHIDSSIKNKAAIIWENENGDTKTLTYFQLYHFVNKFANALKTLGIKSGDRVIIYLPTIPEIVIAMLACSRIGAIHVVVFSGFSAKALSDRARDASR